MPTEMRRRGRTICALGVFWAGLWSMGGCATPRRLAPSPDLRPCTDDYTYTKDGWRLGVRHYRPQNPDPGKLPVVLCHGLGLNATFWTITDNHLPYQLTARGYEVFVFDIRGSGENARLGGHDRLNKLLRQTFCGAGRTAVDGRRSGPVRRAGGSGFRQLKDRPRPRQLDRSQPRRHAGLPVPRVVAQPRADREFCRDGQHNHSEQHASHGYAPGQPCAADCPLSPAPAGWGGR